MANLSFKMENLSLRLDDEPATCDHMQTNPQETCLLSIQHCIKYLIHACQCRDANCQLPSCQMMKRVVQQTKGCKLKTNIGCPICKQLAALCCYHAEHCRGDMTIEPSSASKFDKRESYKAQRKNYRRKKKRVAKELSTTLKDPSIIVLADWLKVRGILKGWTKWWCVLKPGLLLLYKSPKTHKSSHWVGTVLLNACELIERPSKKDGFCFKLYHPLKQSIWAYKGPKGETIGALVQPLPIAHLIFRAPSEQAGKCWMDALELALRCPSLLMKSKSGREAPASQSQGTVPTSSSSHEDELVPSWNILERNRFLPIWNEVDPEKHFQDHGSNMSCSFLHQHKEEA